MNIRQQAADQAVQQTTGFLGSKMATGMTVGGGGVTVIGGLTLNEFAIVFGMVVGLLGLCLQVYQTLHKRSVYIAERRLIEGRAQREREEHAAKMGMYQ